MTKSNSIFPAELEGIINKYSPYLMEVKKRLFFTLSVFFIGMVGGFVFYEKIILFLIRILDLRGINIVFTSPFQFINLAFSCGFTVGLIFAFPLIISQVLSFLKPALRAREYKMVLYMVPFGIFLFLVGFFFGAVIMKWQIQIFLGRSTTLGIGNILDISKLLSVVLVTSAIMGVGFQSPIALLTLMRMKVLKEAQVAKQRPWVYLGAFIFALLLPIDSVVADIILTLPLVMLFEVTLILHKVMVKTHTENLLEGA